MVLSWEGEPRAVILPASFQDCRDVLEASTVLTSSTQCPFGVGIYSLHPGSSSPKKLLPLIYVSERVAKDRSPAAHMWNGAGVKAGWYVIAEPGRFQVNVSHVNLFQYGLPWEDGLRITLEVDGEKVHQSFAYKQGQNAKKVKGSETVFFGFVEKSISTRGTRNEQKQIRPFAFENLEGRGREGEGGGSEVGTIKLKVFAGVVKNQDQYPGRETSFLRSSVGVSEKLKAKEGRTLGVGSNEPIMHSKCTLADFYVHNQCSVPEAEVVIHVRQRSWLRSRRLITDDGKPCKFFTFRKLLMMDNAQTVKAEVIDVDEKPAAKKRKIKDEIVIDDVEPIAPGEVINLCK